MNKERGIDIVNDQGLPTVRIERSCIIDGHQFYRVRTEKDSVEIRVTPTGLLRVPNEIGANH